MLKHKDAVPSPDRPRYIRWFAIGAMIGAILNPLHNNDKSKMQSGLQANIPTNPGDKGVPPPDPNTYPADQSNTPLRP